MTFHPDVALQAMDEVKRRRQHRVAAAAEVHLGFAVSCAHCGNVRVRDAPPAAFALRASANLFPSDQAFSRLWYRCHSTGEPLRMSLMLPLQTLASVAALLQDAPAFKNREGNFAADAVDDVAPHDTLQLPSGDSDAAADDADDGQVVHFTTCALSVRCLIR